MPAKYESFKQLEFPLDINTINQNDLKKIPGIGPELAFRIIQYRSEHGSFDSLDSLEKVKGIGRKKIEVMKTYVTVDNTGLKIQQ